ncbi:MAG: hydroxymethylbilane synthase [Ottowia sp.]|nr:hydroxymethylbilane synthase [Ottowia sp.]
MLIVTAPPLPAPQRLIIASRKSRLAIWQAEHVRSHLQTHYPHCIIEILGLSTRGDEILDRSLSKIGGKGLFVKELEQALDNGQADLAVHSLKDVPMVLPPNFSLTTIMMREDPRDALVSPHYKSLADLPSGSIVGTSSLRREALIKQQFPHLNVRPLRGNLDTRLNKLDRGEYAAIILAAAGLKRLGLSARIRTLLTPEQSLPAVGQGALGIEISTHRTELAAWLTPLHHQPTALSVTAERALAQTLGSSCQHPLAAYADWQSPDTLRLRAMVGSPNGTTQVRDDLQARVITQQDAHRLGEQLAQRLIEKGADRILASLGS